jgi:hypothetical protein
LVFFLALGLVLDAWLKPVLETTLDVPGLLASLTSGAARPKGLCSAFDGSRMISIRLTHIYLSILNIYSYSYIYIYLSIPPLNPGIYILGKKTTGPESFDVESNLWESSRVDDAKVETCWNQASAKRKPQNPRHSSPRWHRCPSPS